MRLAARALLVIATAFWLCTSAGVDSSRAYAQQADPSSTDAGPLNTDALDAGGPKTGALDAGARAPAAQQADGSVGDSPSASEAIEEQEALAARAAALAEESAAAAADNERVAAERERTLVLAEFAAARAQQLRYEADTKALVFRLDRNRIRHGELLHALLFESPPSSVDDPRFLHFSSELARVRRLTIDSIAALWRAAKEPGEAPKLAQAQATVLGELATTRFAEDSAKLDARANILLEKRESTRLWIADTLHLQSVTLTKAFASLLARAPTLRHQLRTIRSETAHELGGEAVQTVMRATYWVTARKNQLIDLPQAITTASVATVVWDFSKFVLLILALFWALARWPNWMQATIEFIGRSASYGRSALLLVRLAESAKKFGPSLLILLSALASYRLISSIGVEFDLALQLVIAISALRVQLRLVESMAESLQRVQLEREREKELLATDELASSDLDAGVVGESSAEASKPPPKLEAFWKLVAKTWRRVTRYVSVFVVLLVVTNFAVGRGVAFGVLIRWAWLGAIPLMFFILRTWRARIVHELSRRSSGKDVSLLGRLAARHSHRIIGLPIVLAAFFVVLGRRSAGFVKRHFFELNSTKRILAFLFRRQVQKHARQHGRVLEDPPQLPQEILAQFNELSVDELLPPRESVLPQLTEAFSTWQEKRVDGSVAVVGDTGMGKTAVLRCFVESLRSDLTETKTDSTEGELDELDGDDPDGAEKANDADSAEKIVGVEGTGEKAEADGDDANDTNDTNDAIPVIAATVTNKITEPADLFAWLAAKLELENQPSSEEHLIHEIKRCKAQVISIDSCHHLFLRQVGGFDAWEAFIRIVNETCNHVFWVLGFGKVAWEYLANVGGRVVYFRRVLELPEWTEVDLRRLILKRMRLAGYRANFSDLLVTRIEGVQMRSQVIRTSQGYFRLLWDYADGNPTLASYFWLRSLVPEESGKSVRVHLFSAPKIEDLEKLPDEIAFVLTAVLEHESATAAELALITNLSLELCRFAVRFGRERGYLESRDRRVVVSRLWRRTIMTYLKRKHLLYS